MNILTSLAAAAPFKKMAVTWKRLNPERALSQVEAITAIYREAFTEPPFCENESHVARFRDSWEGSIQAPGFSFVAATAPHGEMVGFACGWPSRADDKWHSVLAKSAGEEWCRNAFVLAELAVKRKYRGLGLGKILSDVLLRPVAQETAYLITLDSDTHAYRLYKKEGWERIAPGIAPKLVALGKRLPGRVNAI
jgi:ribosomal protein S18 acetylase RimI-like enzyme